MVNMNWFITKILLKIKWKFSKGWRNSSVSNASDLVTHHWAAHHCVGGSNPNACETSLASHAIYMLIQCTPLLVEKAGVTPEVNLRTPLCTGEEACKRGNPPWLWNPGQTSPEVQNRGISGPTKRTCVLQNLKKKKSGSFPENSNLKVLWIKALNYDWICTICSNCDSIQFKWLNYNMADWYDRRIKLLHHCLWSIHPKGWIKILCPKRL